MLVNIANSSHNSPQAQGLTALDVWLVTCQVFVAGSLFEYAALLRMTFNGAKGTTIRDGATFSSKHNQKSHQSIHVVDKYAIICFLGLFLVFILCYNIVYAM